MRYFNLLFTHKLCRATLTAGALFALAGTSDGQSNKTQNAPAPPTFAYVTNAPGDNLIFQYRVGADSALTTLSPPSVSTGRFTQAITADPEGRFVYAANSTDGTLSQYRIQANGTLAPLSPATLTIPGRIPNALVVSPDSRFLYVATFLYATKDPNGEAVVSQFRIKADGTLSSLSPATVPLKETGQPVSITVDPKGRFAYVANFSGHDVSQLHINKNGTLALLTPPYAASGDIPTSVTTDATGRFVYAACQRDSSLWQYQIKDDGTLAPLTPTPLYLVQSDGGGSNPSFLAHHPTKPLLYVTNGDGRNLITYRIDGKGALSPTGPPVPLPSVASGIAVDPAGRFLYVTNTGSNTGLVSQFAIASDGTLSTHTQATAVVGRFPDAIVIVRPQPPHRYSARTR